MRTTPRNTGSEFCRYCRTPGEHGPELADISPQVGIPQDEVAFHLAELCDAGLANMLIGPKSLTVWWFRSREGNRYVYRLRLSGEAPEVERPYERVAWEILFTLAGVSSH